MELISETKNATISKHTVLSRVSLQVIVFVWLRWFGLIFRGKSRFSTFPECEALVYWRGRVGGATRPFRH